MAAAIEIQPDCPAWPGEFTVLAGNIRNAMGDLAVRIVHIGSTSVPGLMAKNIIDIQVSVAQLGVPEIAARLSSIGYAIREDIVGDHIPPGYDPDPGQWRKQYFRAPADQRPTHLHVRQLGLANQRYALLFRDCLRAHRHLAETYAEIKSQLARLHPEDVDAYYAIKDPVCDLIMSSAEMWAASTAYSAGPTDA